MIKPIVKIINAETGEVIEREMTKSEYDLYLVEKEQGEAIRAEKIAKERARQSALEKLAALGLTEAEIQALAG